MSFAKEVWDTLSKVDVSGRIEKKGNLSYLSWAWAWATLMKYYPQADYKVEGPVMFTDQTAEVGCWMMIGKGDESVERQMWLPVLDHKNSPIKNPNSFQINTAKMRCLTKCISMYGLGNYIYAGEDLPPGPTTSDWVEQYEDSIKAIQSAIADGDLSTASEEWFSIPEKAKYGLWVAPTKGGPFTTREREIMKSAEFREANGTAL